MVLLPTLVAGKRFPYILILLPLGTGGKRRHKAQAIAPQARPSGAGALHQFENPWNPHDPSAVAVCVGGHQVGHLPAEMCLDYAPHLIKLARKEVLATGEARLWAKSDAGMVRARVTILIPEAHRFR